MFHMNLNFLFFFNNILLGVGLAMDAFSVSLTNGLSNPSMKKKRMCGIASVYGIFQGMMPMIGWICVHTVLQYFEVFKQFIPWIALILLLYVGIKMLIDGIKGDDEEASGAGKLTFKLLLVQGIATSIDALCVGFTIADYDVWLALIASLIIAFVTFLICIIGLVIGKAIGTRFSSKAQILGGIILIAIGIEIFIKGVFF